MEKGATSEGVNNHMKYIIPCIINVEEFSRQATGYAYLVRLDKLLVHMYELKAVEKRMASIFEVNKRQNKIIKSAKN